jgi:hypothetical protein
MTVAEDREFQLQMLTAQSSITNWNSYFTALTAVSLSLFGVLLALTSSIANSILGGPTTMTGNFTNGTTTWTGELSGVTNVNPAYFSFLTYAEYLFLVIGFFGFFILLYFNLCISPKRIDRIRQRFVASTTNETLNQPSPTVVTETTASANTSKVPRPEDLLAQYTEAHKNQRFLLRLLWEIPSIAIAISSAFFVAAYNFFPNGSNDPLIRCFLLASGALLMFTSFLAVVKHRFYRGIWLKALGKKEEKMKLDIFPLYVEEPKETESYTKTFCLHKPFITHSVETLLANVILLTAIVFAIFAFINLCQYFGLF